MARLVRRKTLHVEEEKYRNLVERISDLIYEIDHQGVITYLSPRVKDILGYEPAELIGKSFLVLVHEDDRSRITERFAELSRGIELASEYRLYDKSGKLLWVRTKSSPIFVDEEFGGARGLLIDITGHKLVEEALKDSEANYRALAESAQDIIFIIDDRRRFSYFNIHGLEQVGRTAEELLGKKVSDIFSGALLESMETGLSSVFETGGPFRHELKISHPSGIVWEDIKLIPLFAASGKVHSIMGIARDITERMRAEEKIKSLLSEKELLLHEVHHRIRNDLNTIISLLTLQARRLKDPSAVTSLNDASNRVQSMKVLYTVLYQSADFKKISTKEYLSFLTDEITAMFTGMEFVAVEKHIDDIIIDADIVSPLGIIINELLTNAMKHAFTGRDNGVIKVSFSARDRHATLIIEDNGAGIPESIDISSSTGFGLHLVDSLTGQIGGTIRLERRKGSKFIVEFDM